MTLTVPHSRELVCNVGDSLTQTVDQRKDPDDTVRRNATEIEAHRERQSSSAFSAIPAPVEITSVKHFATWNNAT